MDVKLAISAVVVVVFFQECDNYCDLKCAFSSQTANVFQFKNRLSSSDRMALDSTGGFFEPK